MALDLFRKKKDKEEEQKQNNSMQSEKKEVKIDSWLGWLGDEGAQYIEALSYAADYNPDMWKIQWLLENRPEVKFWKSLMRKVLEMDVTDIHFEPEQLHYMDENGDEIIVGSVVIRFNINGEKIFFDILQPEIYDRILKVVKDMYKMKADEALYHQNGSGEVREVIHEKEIRRRLRLSIIPTVYTYGSLGVQSNISHNSVENLVVRILANKIYKLEELGLLFYQDYLISALKDTGAVLFTWPTSHGKTTTQVAALDFVRKIIPTKKYYTVEDPVEIIVSGYMDKKNNKYIPGITPIEKTQFLTKLDIQKHFLRWNPDVVVIWELTTAEDIEFTKNMANTWHTVVGTLHTESTTDLRTRLESENINYNSFIQVVRLIISQRLLIKPYKSISIYNFKKNFNKYKHDLWYSAFLNEWENILKYAVFWQLIRPNLLWQKFYLIENIKKKQKKWQMINANIEKLEKYYKLLKLFFFWNKKYEKFSPEVFKVLTEFIEKNILISDILTDNEKDILVKEQFKEELQKKPDLDKKTLYAKLRNIKWRQAVYEFAVLSDPNLKKYFNKPNITEGLLDDIKINFLTIFQDFFLKSLLFAEEGFIIDKERISFDFMNDTVLQWLSKHDYGINKRIEKFM